jgi:fructokinase
VRTPNPGTYDAAISAVVDVIGKVEAEAGASRSIGMGAPGSISPRTGLIRNSNSLYLNGRNFREDLEAALGRPIRMANDANCLALSEAVDGAGQGAPVVFAAILGTGCGGGIVVDGRLLEGANGIAGEWGHTPLPWQTDEERGAAPCWCGRQGCLEIWISGSAFVADYRRRTGRKLDGQTIMAAARTGEAAAVASFDAYIDRTGRALGAIINILDPDAIVLGGGMSNTAELYPRLPDAIRPHVFADAWDTPIRPAAHGDSSGVRGAAWLWPQEADA